MRVISPLANMSMYIGSVGVAEQKLVIESDSDSTMPAQVFVTHQDVAQFIKAMLKNPRALLWVLLSPLRALFARGEVSTDAGSRLQDPINKPW